MSKGEKVQPEPKMYFGLTPKAIEYIEQAIEKNGFNYHNWQSIAKHIGWEPLTAACYYVEHEHKKQREQTAEIKKVEVEDFMQWAIDNQWRLTRNADARWYRQYAMETQFSTTSDLYTQFLTSKNESNGNK